MLNHHGRTNNDTEYMIPLLWSADRENSYGSFVECVDSWQAKSEEDPSIDMEEIFGISVDAISLRKDRKSGN